MIPKKNSPFLNILKDSKIFIIPKAKVNTQYKLIKNNMV